MKNVFLKSLNLHYFKGTKNRQVDFKSYSTDIAGPNGSGKTTIFDAFTWLLFGKDSHDRKDFNIKTLDSSGANVEKVEHTVEGVLSVDGTEFSLKRVFKENWVTKRGSIEPELKGHETLYYINEVPRKAGEYAAEINELIDESLFKLLTNPRYFANLNWKNQRDILFTMAGTVTDAEIAHGNREFEAILEKLSGKKLADYKIEIASKKKKLKDDLEAIPTRVDEAERSKPESVDFTEIETKITALNGDVSDIDNAIEDASRAFALQFEANQEIQKEINANTVKQAHIVFNANQTRRDQDFKIKAEKREIENQISDTKRRISSLKQSIQFTEKQKVNTANLLDSLRKKWHTVNDSTFTEKEGVLTCPVFNIICDSPKAAELHKANADAARYAFNKKKVEEINTINTQGKELNNDMEAHNLEIANVQKDIEAEETELQKLQNKLLAYPADDAKPHEITGSNIPEWLTIQKMNDELKTKLVSVEKPDNSALKAQKQDLLQVIDGLKKQLAGKDQIDRIDNRIAELNQTGRNLAQQIADLEKDELTLDAFNRAKIEECESRINGKFKFVTFKLFNQQLNGGESETCEMLIDGVPYSDANTASQINAGLDVINVLSEFNGVSAPIFIDGRESVTDILPVQSQVINLIVTNSKKLTVI